MLELEKRLIAIIFLSFLIVFLVSRPGKVNLKPPPAQMPEVYTQNPVFTGKKKGVAVPAWIEGSPGYYREPANSLRDIVNINTKFGATWYYNWGNYYSMSRYEAIKPELEKALCRYKIEFIPMIWGNWSSSYLPAISLYAKNHPGSYWLIWNEPNLSQQANISPAQAASQYDTVRNAIKTADPAAKLIIGGVLLVNPDGRDWLDQFVTAYKNTHNQNKPEIDGIHVHFYGDVVVWIVNNPYRTPMQHLNIRMNEIIGWLNNNYPGKELWVTEYGVLGKTAFEADSRNGTADDFVKNATQYLENNNAVARYAVFASWWPGDVRLFDKDVSGSNTLTSTGTVYGSIASKTISQKTLSEVCGNDIDDDCNGRIDDGGCECRYDYDRNRSLGVGDIQFLLANWQGAPSLSVLMTVIQNWGAVCS